MQYQIMEYTLTDNGIEKDGKKVDIYDVISDIKNRVSMNNVSDSSFKVYKNGMVVYQITCGGIHKIYEEKHEGYTSIFAICGNKAIIAVNEGNTTVWMSVAHYYE